MALDFYLCCYEFVFVYWDRWSLIGDPILDGDEFEEFLYVSSLCALLDRRPLAT